MEGAALESRGTHIEGDAAPRFLAAPGSGLAYRIAESILGGFSGLSAVPARQVLVVVPKMTRPNGFPLSFGSF
jgi:hypothetical protein